MLETLLDPSFLLLAQDDAAGGMAAMACSCIMGLVVLALMGLWVWMLIDCISKEPSEGNDKIIWILVIVFAGGLGALLYYFIRRPKRIAEHGQ